MILAMKCAHATRVFLSAQWWWNCTYMPGQFVWDIVLRKLDHLPIRLLAALLHACSLIQNNHIKDNASAVIANTSKPHKYI
jgi:hypothetical protein